MTNAATPLPIAPLARWRPNVTVAALIEREGRYLLVEEHTDRGLKLNTPAGHLDPGESPAEGCAREALEETAHHFTPTALVGIYMARFERATPGDQGETDITYLRFAFCGELGAFEPDLPLDTGIERTVWMTLDEIRASVDRHRSPLLLQCVEDHLAGQRYPLDLFHMDPSIHAPGPA
ncbi:MAG: NUDIX hydrolase [Comamonadaceae bacterium]|nr:MAG: NUDIX hydrolase [Comamonadaceae bacterium]